MSKLWMPVFSVKKKFFKKKEREKKSPTSSQSNSPTSGSLWVFDVKIDYEYFKYYFKLSFTTDEIQNLLVFSNWFVISECTLE